MSDPTLRHGTMGLICLSAQPSSEAQSAPQLSPQVEWQACSCRGGARGRGGIELWGVEKGWEGEVIREKGGLWGPMQAHHGTGYEGTQGGRPREGKDSSPSRRADLCI